MEGRRNLERISNKESNEEDRRKNLRRKKMKTFNQTIKASVAALLALSLTACFSGTGSTTSTEKKTGTTSSYAYLLDTTGLEFAKVDIENAEGALKTILEEGVLTVATSPDYPPAEWIADDGTVYGSEMMLAKYIADSLGVDLKIETMDFSGTLVAVDTGKVDLAMSGYGWKKDRAENYELSNGYSGDPDGEAAKHTLIVPAGQEGNYKSLADFEGKHIMAQATSLQEMYVTDQIVANDSSTEYEPVATLDQAILGLASGKCDAVALDNSTAENYVESSEGQFALTKVYFDLSAYGDYQGNVAAAKKGETSLIEAVNAVIKVAQEKGYYEQWYTEAKAAAGIEE